MDEAFTAAIKHFMKYYACPSVQLFYHLPNVKLSQNHYGICFLVEVMTGHIQLRSDLVFIGHEFVIMYDLTC